MVVFVCLLFPICAEYFYGMLTERLEPFMHAQKCLLA